MIWRPPSLSELTPIKLNIELTLLGSNRLPYKANVHNMIKSFNDCNPIYSARNDDNTII